MAEANSTVTYKDIPGFPGYRVGDDGSVWSRWRSGRGSRPIHPWREMKQTPHPDGYWQIRLTSPNGIVTTQVHRLVLAAFVGPKPDGCEGCHEDGNGFNNSRHNLRWDTPAGNQTDRARHGTIRRGSQIHQAKITDEIVTAIRTDYRAGGISQLKLARKYGISQSNVHFIVTRRTWAHVP
jgi:hypothetical protein